MDNPLYAQTVTIGGNDTTYNAPKVLGIRIHADQSFDLQYTFVKSDLSTAFDVASSTSEIYVTAYKNVSYTPVLLASGVNTDSGSGTTDRVTFTVPAEAIPNDIANFPIRNPGNSVFYAIITDGAGKKIEVVAEVNIFDTEYSLTGDAAPSAQTIVPIKNDLGTVISSNLTTPPTATLNNAYIVGGSATGDWSGQDNDLAIGTGTAWVFLTPLEGNFVYDENQAVQIIFNGTAWVSLAESPFSDALPLVKNAADATKLIGFDASAITTATERTITMPDADVDLTSVSTALQNIVEDTTPQLGGTLDTNSKQVRLSKGADVASGTALTLGTDGNYFDITGTTTITSIATLAIGTEVTLHFDGIVTLTYHATDLVLPSAANVTTAAGDEFTFIEYATGDWRCTSYALASGEAIVGAAGGGNFPTSTDSADKTTAYTVLVGDENTTVVAGSATSADFTMTYNVGLWTTAGSLLTVANESAYIIKVLVSNTGTMTIGGGIDAFVGPNETITMSADTATHVRVVART